MTQGRKVGVIVGSLRGESFSRKVANALIGRAPSDWSMTVIEIGDLPLYNQDLDAEPPKPWTAFRDAVSGCDALLFVTPEYNRSIPGVLKNATDIGSRPEGANVFDGMPAAIVSVSPYSAGGMAANHALRQSFVYLNLAVMQQPEAYIRDAADLFDHKGEVKDAATEKQLKSFMDGFGQWIARVGRAPPAEPFDTFMKHREDVSNAYIAGDAGPLEAIATVQDPATFFPPSGDRVVGAEAVNAANRKGAKAFAKGGAGRLEVLASAAGPDLAFWTGLQHAEAHLKGKDGPVAMKLRTTEIFRNEGGEWKLIHRHADMIDNEEN